MIGYMVYNVRAWLLLSLVLYSSCYILQAECVRVTVYVHGTIASSLTGLMHSYCSSDEFDEDALGTRLVLKWRKNLKISRDLIIGPLGFHEIIPGTLPSWQAAYYLIPAYDDILKLADEGTYIRKYATFGWSGLLHYGARKQAGYDLYKRLCEYRDQLIQHYADEPDFEIIAHSHGGNVALWLADAEKIYQKNLKIKTLVMFGTPMQSSMKDCLKSPVFSSIIMCYSDGDAIQTKDYFSSKDRKSYPKIADVIGDDRRTGRYDLRLLINGNRKHIDHTNMWLAGRSIPLAQEYDLLPLMVLSPLIIQLTKELDTKIYAADLNIKIDAHGCNLVMQGSRMLCPSMLLHKWLSHWSMVMRTEWAQLDSDTSRHPLFNKKNWMIAKEVLLG